MNKEIFVRYKGKGQVDILLRPNGLYLTGFIDNTFEDCFEFRTAQKSSFIDYNDVSALAPPHERKQRTE